MELVIEAVAKTGKGIKAGGAWYNADKKMDGDFKGLKPGDVINAVLNENWVKSYELAGHTTPPAKKNTFASKSSMPMDGDRAKEIARAVAIKAVFEGTVIPQMTKDMGNEEAMAFSVARVKDIETYLITGEFSAQAD